MLDRVRRILVASASSRKSIAVARSIVEVLRKPVVGVFHAPHPHRFSKVFSKRIALSGIDRRSDSWARIVAKIAKDLGCSVVVPIDFVDFETFSRCVDLFDSLGIVLVSPPYQKLVEVSNKARLPQLLQGVADTPRQVVVESIDDLDRVNYLEPPLVVKGLGDASNPKYFSDRSNALEEARRRIPCIVQEYVAGIGRGYYAACMDGEPLLEFTHERIVEYEPIGGPSLAARGPVLDPKLFALGRKIVAKLRWCGPIMVETKYVAHEDRYVVIEVNPKFWGSIDLPTSLGYYFAPILVVAFVEGIEVARRVAKSLRVRSGCYSWILDGLRYLAKDWRTWCRLVGLGSRCCKDLDLGDPVRCLVQIFYALKRFRRERCSWLRYVEDSYRETSTTLQRLRVARQGVGFVLDLDGTLIELAVDWRRVRREVVERFGMPRGSSLMGWMLRLKRRDPKLFEEVSKFVERFELEAVERSRLLVEPRIFRKLLERCGGRVCIATKQSSIVAERVLQRLGVEGLPIAARDLYEPSKEVLYRACLEKLGTDRAIVLDDALDGIVAALRLGLVPIAVARHSYAAWRFRRLGVATVLVDRLNDFLEKLVS